MLEGKIIARIESAMWIKGQNIIEKEFNWNTLRSFTLLSNQRLSYN